MSKFWGGDSGSESESESSDDEPILNQRAPQTGGRFGANYDESDSGIYIVKHVWNPVNSDFIIHFNRLRG